MKNIAVFILLLSLVGCSPATQTKAVSDVTKHEIIVLKKSPSKGNVHSIKIVGRGEIEGDADIALLLNGSTYKTTHLSGKIDFTWTGDWYSDQADVEFTPAIVKSGSITLKYDFGTF